MLVDHWVRALVMLKYGLGSGGCGRIVVNCVLLAVAHEEEDGSSYYSKATDAPDSTTDNSISVDFVLAAATAACGRGR